MKHLRLVRSIAETVNMTKAAQNLCITQSALSQQLKGIEDKLKVDLFFRARKKMILTATGKKLLKAAEKVIDLLDDMEIEIGTSYDPIPELTQKKFDAVITIVSPSDDNFMYLPLFKDQLVP